MKKYRHVEVEASMVGGLLFDGRLITRDNAAQSAFASMRQKVEAVQAAKSNDKIT